MRERNHVKFQVRYNEADARFPVVSIDESVTLVQLVRVRSRLSSDVVRRISQDMCEGPKCVKVGETRSVLVAMFVNRTHGWIAVVPKSFCPNPRVARLAVEAPPISVPDPDATPMQLEES